MSLSDTHPRKPTVPTAVPARTARPTARNTQKNNGKKTQNHESAVGWLSLTTRSAINVAPKRPILSDPELELMVSNLSSERIEDDNSVQGSESEGKDGACFSQDLCMGEIYAALADPENLDNLTDCASGSIELVFGTPSRNTEDVFVDTD